MSRELCTVSRPEALPSPPDSREQRTHFDAFGASAAGSAPTTSANPPVLMSGYASAATERTRRLDVQSTSDRRQAIDHRLRDQAHASFGAPETRRIVPGVFANHQPLRESSRRCR